MCLLGDKMNDYNDFVCQYRTAQFGYSLEALMTSNDLSSPLVIKKMYQYFTYHLSELTDHAFCFIS